MLRPAAPWCTAHAAGRRARWTAAAVACGRAPAATVTVPMRPIDWADWAERRGWGVEHEAGSCARYGRQRGRDDDPGAWVLSGSVAGWGDDIVAECDAVVFVTLDPTKRIRRLRVREHAAGPVDGAAHWAFLDWARGYDDPAFTGRSRAGDEQWLAGLSLPVLPLDAGSPTAQLCRAILDWDPSGTSPRNVTPARRPDPGPGHAPIAGRSLDDNTEQVRVGSAQAHCPSRAGGRSVGPWLQ